MVTGKGAFRIDAKPSYAALSTSLSQAAHPGTGARREPYEPRHGDDRRPFSRADQLWCGCGLVDGGSTRAFAHLHWSRRLRFR